MGVVKRERLYILVKSRDRNTVQRSYSTLEKEDKTRDVPGVGHRNITGTFLRDQRRIGQDQVVESPFPVPSSLPVILLSCVSGVTLETGTCIGGYHSVLLDGSRRKAEGPGLGRSMGDPRVGGPKEGVLSGGWWFMSVGVEGHFLSVVPRPHS